VASAPFSQSSESPTAKSYHSELCVLYIDQRNECVCRDGVTRKRIQSKGDINGSIIAPRGSAHPQTEAVVGRTRGGRGGERPYPGGKGTVEKFGINPMHYERRKTGGWRSSRKITSTRQEGRRGTGSSNPHPSSSESYANLTSSIMASCARPELTPPRPPKMIDNEVTLLRSLAPSPPTVFGPAQSGRRFLPAVPSRAASCCCFQMRCR
jgi:hypothetical protein